MPDHPSKHGGKSVKSVGNPDPKFKGTSTQVVRAVDPKFPGHAASTHTKNPGKAKG